MARLRNWPKYVVEWQTDFDDEAMSPQAAAIEALRELRERDLHVDVHDVDSRRRWCIGFRAHEFEVVECRELQVPIELPHAATTIWLRPLVILEGATTAEGVTAAEGATAAATSSHRRQSVRPIIGGVNLASLAHGRRVSKRRAPAGDNRCSLVRERRLLASGCRSLSSSLADRSNAPT
jgi:hypothetical protein